MKVLKVIAIVAGVAVSLLAGSVLGNNHFMTGSQVSGIAVQPKLSFSFSETFINLDTVMNMPAIAARAQYPMFVAMLEATGRIEPPAPVRPATTGTPLRSISDVKIGMTRTQVVLLLGPPEHVDQPGGGTEILSWRGGGMVSIQNGQVVKTFK